MGSGVCLFTGLGAIQAWIRTWIRTQTWTGPLLNVDTQLPLTCVNRLNWEMVTLVCHANWMRKTPHPICIYCMWTHPESLMLLYLFKYVGNMFQYVDQKILHIIQGEQCFSYVHNKINHLVESSQISVLFVLPTLQITHNCKLLCICILLRSVWKYHRCKVYMIHYMADIPA